MSRRKRTNGMVLRMDGVEGALYAEVEGKRVAKEALINRPKVAHWRY